MSNADNSQYSPIECQFKVTYKDLATGETASEDDMGVFSLTQGNWSCDCNRAMAFDLETEGDYCAGCTRFIVVDVEAEGLSAQDRQWIIDHANEEYPDQ